MRTFGSKYLGYICVVYALCVLLSYITLTRQQDPEGYDGEGSVVSGGGGCQMQLLEEVIIQGGQTVS